MIIRLYILLVSYFLLTWLSGYFGCKVINKLDLNSVEQYIQSYNKTSRMHTKHLVLAGSIFITIIVREMLTHGNR